MKKAFLPLLAILALALASCGGGGGGGGPVASVLGEPNIQTGTPIIIEQKPDPEPNIVVVPSPAPATETEQQTGDSGESQTELTPAPEIVVVPEPETQTGDGGTGETTEIAVETTESTSTRPPRMSEVEFFNNLHLEQKKQMAGGLMAGETYNAEFRDTRATSSTAPLAPRVGYSTRSTDDEIKQSATAPLGLPVLPLPDGSDAERFISPTVKFVSTNPRAESFSVNEQGIGSFVARNHHIRGEKQPKSTYTFNINDRVAVANERLPAGYSVDDRFHFILDNIDQTRFYDRPVQYGYVSYTRMGRYAHEDGYAYKKSDLVDYSFLQTSIGETPGGNLPNATVNYEGIVESYFSLPNEDISIANSWANHDNTADARSFRDPLQYVLGEFDMQVNFGTGSINATITQKSSTSLGIHQANTNRVIGTYRGYMDILNPNGSTFLGDYTASAGLDYTLENFGLYGGFYGPNAEEVSALGMGDYVVSEEYRQRWGLEGNRGRAVMALLGQQERFRDYEPNIDFLAGLNINSGDHYLTENRSPNYLYSRQGDFNFVTTSNSANDIRVKRSTWYGGQPYYFVEHSGYIQYGLQPIRQLKDESLGNIFTALKRDWPPTDGQVDNNHVLALVNTDKLFGDEYTNARLTIMSLLSGDNAINVLATNKDELFNEGIDYKEFAFLFAGENPTSENYNFGNNVVEYRGDTITAYDRSGGSVGEADFLYGEFKLDFNFANNRIAGNVYDVDTNFNENSMQGSFAGNLGNNPAIVSSGASRANLLGHVEDTHTFYGTYNSLGESPLAFDVSGKFYGSEGQELAAIGQGNDRQTWGVIGFIGKKHATNPAPPRPVEPPAPPIVPVDPVEPEEVPETPEPEVVIIPETPDPEPETTPEPETETGDNNNNDGDENENENENEQIVTNPDPVDPPAPPLPPLPPVDPVEPTNPETEEEGENTDGETTTTDNNNDGDENENEEIVTNPEPEIEQPETPQPPEVPVVPEPFIFPEVAVTTSHDYFASFIAEQQARTLYVNRVKKGFTYTAESNNFLSTNPDFISFFVDENRRSNFVASASGTTSSFNFGPGCAVSCSATETLPSGIVSEDEIYDFSSKTISSDTMIDAPRTRYGYVSFVEIKQLSDVTNDDYFRWQSVSYSYVDTSIGATPAGNLPKASVNYEGDVFGRFHSPRHKSEYHESTHWSEIAHQIDEFEGIFDMQVDFTAGTVNAQITKTYDGYLPENSQPVATYAGSRDTDNPNGATFTGTLTKTGRFGIAGYSIENFELSGGFYGPNAEEVSLFGSIPYAGTQASNRRGGGILALIGRQSSLADAPTDFSAFAGLNVEVLNYIESGEPGYDPNDIPWENGNTNIHYYEDGENFDMVTTDVFNRSQYNPHKSIAFYNTKYHQDSDEYTLSWNGEYRFNPLLQMKDSSLGNIVAILTPTGGYSVISGNHNYSPSNSAVLMANTSNLYGDEYREARFTVLAALASVNAPDHAENDKSAKYGEVALVQSSGRLTRPRYNFGTETVKYVGDALTVYDSTTSSISSADLTYGKFEMDFNFGSNNIVGKVYNGTQFNDNDLQGNFTGTIAKNLFSGTYTPTAHENLDFTVRGGFYGRFAEEISAIGHAQDEATGTSGIVGFVGKKQQSLPAGAQIQRLPLP